MRHRSAFSGEKALRRADEGWIYERDRKGAPWLVRRGFNRAFSPRSRCRATHGSSAESDSDGERGRAAGHRHRVLHRAELHEGPLDVERASVHTGRTLSRWGAGACDRGKFARLAAWDLVPMCSHEDSGISVDTKFGLREPISSISDWIQQLAIRFAIARYRVERDAITIFIFFLYLFIYLFIFSFLLDE